MKKSETGEYEVVVGNRQLLSAFFIVALLLGVAFGLGYMVGQNTPRSTRPQAEASTPAPDPGPSSLPAPPSVASSDSAVQPSAMETQPAQQTTAASELVTQPARDATPTAPPPSSAPAPASAAQEAPAGSFWQVLAVRQESDAQPFLQTLRDGGMPAVMRKGADGWVRVLVGPYADRAAMAKAKERLETQFRVRSLIRK